MTAPGSHPWILAIDDDPWALEMTAAILGEEGWHVERASSGQEARQIMARLGAPAVVLVDAMMPNEDGFALCRRLRDSAALRRLPIVFITALDDEAVRVDALEAGADDFLTKPVAASLLVARVRTLIELHGRRMADDARSRFAVVLESLGEGVITLDANDEVVHANRAAVTLLGLPRDPTTRVHLPTHIGRHWMVVQGEIGRTGEARLLWRTTDNIAPTALDWRSTKLPGDGEEVWTAVVRDATDLWERDQALGRMLKSLGHKLRTPLTGLSVSLELARDSQVDSMGAEMVEMAQHSANRLHESIIRLLEFVDAAESTPAAAAYQRTDPDELISELRRLGRVAVSSSLTRPVRIEFDLARRAVAELVANAEAAGATNIAIHVGYHPDRTVYFEITDDGSGIPAAAENRVFQPFYQLDRSGEQPGTGLGLSILRASVTRAGGSMGAWSSPDRQTTVWFSLPDLAAATTGAEQSARTPQRSLV